MKWITVLLLSLMTTLLHSQSWILITPVSSDVVVASIQDQDSPLPGWGHTYQWDLEHLDSGTTWTYHTNFNNKTLMLPWYGTYSLRCRLATVHVESQSSYGYYDIFTTIVKPNLYERQLENASPTY
jgi:hypothetical protein